MRGLGAGRRDGRSAFTLIELLVVVAIIALLISILLPSLSKAREQARSTLCASRLSQLTKGLMIYSDDYNEVPPFTSRAIHGPEHEDEFDKIEEWLGSLEDMQAIISATNPGGDYPAADVEVPRSGLMFNYVRFENLYKCPEFERQAALRQNVFNYTRAVWCRKFRPSGGQAEAGEPEIVDRGFGLGDCGGRIMTSSSVKSPAALPMMLDESWQYHVAEGWGTGSGDGSWICADPIFDIISEMGQYHGAKVRTAHGTEAENPPVKSASIAYYDGHVALRRDPVPRGPSDSASGRSLAMWTWQVYREMFEELAFAQLGGSPWTGTF
ncbi:MAG: prepilin-type N-terminal cleavage/methylation domain-containing protein [Phycisphaerae bacterium]|nr:prepilin-type N-terminal cleavage/methylation domain-containing protein [Phycisphaerae bacterium]